MHTANRVVISVIIVNYNVKDFLEQALLSLRRALRDIPSQVIVVDNASADGSVPMLKKRFPEVELIESERNLGFSRANNLGIEKARGDFIVLLNPDTVVQEDTFTQLLSFFDQHPEASAATCKILNPDGTFSVDCRHSIPTPATAFWKMIGFSRLFPKSKIFGRYNLTFLDENQTYQVEAISGSFMMMRRETVQKDGKLDEDFFMYCEDIDYCHRINQAGGKIFYVPDSQIIHYKGESTKKNNLDYVITFNRSLYLFYKKHYQQKYVYPFKWLILLGTIIRGMIIYLRNNLKNYAPLIVDLILLNIIMFVAFWIRFEMKTGFRLSDFATKYIVINVITSVIYALAAMFFYSQNRRQLSISNIIKANIITFALVSASTFFFKQFAFSRLVVLFSAMISPMLMALWRWVARYVLGKGRKEKFLLRPTLIVGFDRETERLLKRLTKQIDTGLEILGIVALNRDDVGKKLASFQVVTYLDKLPEYLRVNDIDLVIFTTHNISYRSILTTMSRNTRPGVEFKLVPGHLEFMVGKSTIDRLDTEVPLVDIEYAYGKPFNKFVKRGFDLLVSLFLLTVLFPFILVTLPFAAGKKEKRTLYLGNNKTRTLTCAPGSRWFSFVLKIWNVFTGKLSFVGAPIAFRPEEASAFEYKPGLTGLVQLNARRLSDESAREHYELHYLKNQSFFMDMEILIRSLLGTP